jgi:hypothetical protein
VLWNQGVHTNGEVMANRPDIILVIINRKDITCIPIDVATPAEKNSTPKESGKVIKYMSLCVNIQRM